MWAPLPHLSRQTEEMTCYPDNFSKGGTRGGLKSFWKWEYPKCANWLNNVARLPSSLGMCQMLLLTFLPFAKLWKNFVFSFPTCSQIAWLRWCQVSSLYLRILDHWASKFIRWDLDSTYVKPYPFSSKILDKVDSIVLRICSSQSLLSLAHLIDNLLISCRL